MTTEERIKDLHNRMTVLEEDSSWPNLDYEKAETYYTLYDEWYDLVRQRDFEDDT